MRGPVVAACGWYLGPLTLAVSALPLELWPPGDSQPAFIIISLGMCHQNPVRDRPVTPLHQGRSHTERFFYSHSTDTERGHPINRGGRKRNYAHMQRHHACGILGGKSQHVLQVRKQQKPLYYMVTMATMFLTPIIGQDIST